MARKVASQYPHGVNGVNFAIDQGEFIKDDRFKMGGEFQNPAHVNDLVALGTSPWTVKKAASGDKVIGVAAGEPFGPIEGQAIAVRVFGDMILDIEISDEASEVSIGDYLKFDGNVLTNCGENEKSSFIALDDLEDPSEGGEIPVLCGYYGISFLEGE